MTRIVTGVTQSPILDDLVQRLQHDVVWERVQGGMSRSSAEHPTVDVSWRLGAGGRVRFGAIADDPRHVLVDDAGFVRAATPKQATTFLLGRMLGLPSRGAWDRAVARTWRRRWWISLISGGLAYAAAVHVSRRLGMTTDDAAFMLLLLPASLLVAIGVAIDRFVGDRDRPEGMLFGMLVASTRHSMGLAMPWIIAGAILFIASAAV